MDDGKERLAILGCQVMSPPCLINKVLHRVEFFGLSAGNDTVNHAVRHNHVRAVYSDNVSAISGLSCLASPGIEHISRSNHLVRQL